MRVEFTKRRHIPIPSTRFGMIAFNRFVPFFKTVYGEFPLWRIGNLVKSTLLIRQFEKMGFTFSYDYLQEWPTVWEKFYLPPKTVSRDSLIVDVGRMMEILPSSTARMVTGN